MLQERVLRWIKPPTTSLVVGMLADMTRSKSELLAENALLRQQLIILRRQVKRPNFRKTDRFLLVILTRMVRTWKQAIFLALFSSHGQREDVFFLLGCLDIRLHVH
jgi:putative transposase